MKIGVLAVQGDVPEHLGAIQDLLGRGSAGAVRSPADLEQVDALVLPGGESTTIADLLREAGLWGPLARRIASGLPVLATCAGLILLAKRLAPVPGGRDPPTFGVLDVELRRNDYGQQRESFEAPVRVSGLSDGPFPGVFIRAPRILSVFGQTQVLARWGKETVGVRRGPLVGLTFHPELSGDPRVLAWFAREVAAPRQTPRPTRIAPTTKARNAKTPRRTQRQ